MNGGSWLVTQCVTYNQFQELLTSQLQISCFVVPQPCSSELLSHGQVLIAWCPTKHIAIALERQARPMKREVDDLLILNLLLNRAAAYIN